MIAGVCGLVLAGGAGRRMGGVDKGLQPFDGEPLAQRAARRLAHQVDRLWISANRHLDVYAGWGWPVLTDAPEHPDRGPLAGLLAGLSACPTAWLACVPCDVPHFPLDLVARLAAAAPGHQVVYATAPDPAHPEGRARRHPTCCLLHVDLRAPLARHLHAGGRRLDAWMGSVPHAEVAFGDPAAFANLNTLTDLAQAQAQPQAERR